MITFKENTFVKGTYDELMEMAKAIEEKGAEINYIDAGKNSNHLWWGHNLERWSFCDDLSYKCHNELTKSQLYEAYGVVDFSILNETDVFYVELTTGSNWLFKGNNIIKEGKGVHISIETGNIYNQKTMTSKSRIKFIRLATTEEIEPYKEHFKLRNMETRPIQISKETATRWYNGEDNELKQLAIQTFPELDEARPKVGDLCLFGNDERYFNLGVGTVGIYERCRKDGFHECQSYATFFKYCKKIKSIEFYD